MSNRPLFTGTATVEVDQYRYDELLHKEERLSLLESLIAKLPEIRFTFKDLFPDKETETECE